MEFWKGLGKENPTFRLLLGMCPTLAVTTAARNGFWLGVAVTLVLSLTNPLVSALRGIIPPSVRLPALILLIASAVTVVDLLFHAFLPGMYEILGIYIPLTVVNCLILARAESFAFRNTPLRSWLDGLGMGLGFTLALTLVGGVREFLASGNLVLGGVPLLPHGLFPQTLIWTLPPGAFLTLGLILALVNYLERRVKAVK